MILQQAPAHRMEACLLFCILCPQPTAVILAERNSAARTTRYKADILQYMNQLSPYKQRKRLTRRRLVLSIIVLVPVLGFVLFSRRGIIARAGLEIEKKEVLDEIRQAHAQQDSLRATIQQLQADTLLIERLAREKYGMIKPGETVYSVKQE